MSYPPNSPDGVLIQIGMALGQLKENQRNIAQRLDQVSRSLDHLIRILQQATPSKTSSPEDKPASRGFSVATLLERVSTKVLMDLAVMALKAIARSALPYIIPWSVFLGGLAWLGRALLKFLGWS